jgi:hypothetical protein
VSASFKKSKIKFRFFFVNFLKSRVLVFYEGDPATKLSGINCRGRIVGDKLSRDILSGISCPG